MGGFLLSTPYDVIWLEKKPILAKEVALLLHRIGAIRFGNFILSSGRESPYYIDLRILPSYPEILKRVVELYVEMINNEIRSKEEIHRIAGIPTAGLPIATLVSQLIPLPLLYVRKQEKKYGLEKIVEGVIKAGDRVVVVDDVVTTGHSALEQIRVLREHGGIVNHLVVLIDRDEGGESNLAKENVTLHYLMKIGDLFTYLKNLNLVDQEKYDEVMKYVMKYRKGGS
ncbi:MAG: orotate phosphoribosyltransferase [Nitrososphaerota archaeon]|nr:orotate phosphoribosyltransferase [Nitrososphaerales archaeon]MDW8044819.1 orotate phosphoribosyltransferase [Nitrososphaerota archaeon]